MLITIKFGTTYVMFSFLTQNQFIKNKLSVCSNTYKYYILQTHFLDFLYMRMFKNNIEISMK